MKLNITTHLFLALVFIRCTHAHAMEEDAHGEDSGSFKQKIAHPKEKLTEAMLDATTAFSNDSTVGNNPSILTVLPNGSTFVKEEEALTASKPLVGDLLQLSSSD